MRSTSQELKRIYCTKVSINTLVLVGVDFRIYDARLWNDGVKKFDLREIRNKQGKSILTLRVPGTLVLKSAEKPAPTDSSHPPRLAHLRATEDPPEMMIEIKNDFRLFGERCWNSRRDAGNA